MREIFLIFHEKVSIQDAPSCFGPMQISTLLYPIYFSRNFQSSLEAQTQGQRHRLESDQGVPPVHEISWN
jgi:hypothetical protein